MVSTGTSGCPRLDPVLDAGHISYGKITSWTSD